MNLRLGDALDATIDNATQHLLNLDTQLVDTMSKAAAIKFLDRVRVHDV